MKRKESSSGVSVGAQVRTSRLCIETDKRLPKNMGHEYQLLYGESQENRLLNAIKWALANSALLVIRSSCGAWRAIPPEEMRRHMDAVNGSAWLLMQWLKTVASTISADHAATVASSERRDAYLNGTASHQGAMLCPPRFK